MLTSPPKLELSPASSAPIKRCARPRALAKSRAHLLNVLVLGLAFCGTAQAADVASPAPDSATQPAGTSATAGEIWWRPFGLYDYLTVGATAAVYFAVEFGIEDPTSSSWEGPLPVIDNPIRNLVVADTRAQREAADRMSDYGWYASVGYPILVSAIVPVARRADPWVIWDLEMMNLRSFAVASLVTRIPHKLPGRKRPNAVGCESDPDYDEQCGAPAQNQSFFGGHTSLSMTGAGLACAHHLHADLYGGGVADGVACGGAITVASAVMFMRQRADRHWMTDNLVGAAVGLSVGYGLPTLLNYHPFWRDDAETEATQRARQQQVSFRWDVIPMADFDSVGASVVGLF